MHSINLQIEDNIYQNVMFLLNNLNLSGLKIEEVATNNTQKLDDLTNSVATALSEAKQSKSANKNLTNAWDLLEEL